MTTNDVNRYHRALHAVQSGVAADQSSGSPDGSPKHLRTGINSAMAGQSALAQLLIDAGIITADDLQRALADAMEAEQARYEELLGVKLA